MPSVLADTSVIIEFFRPGGRPDVVEELGSLLESGQLAICGIVISELLQGVRPAEKEPVESLVSEAHYIEFAKEDFESAGHMANGLRRKGIKVPITDALIAALCLRSKMSIYSLDTHFKYFAGLTSHP